MTALAYVWTPEEIIIAADSKITSSDKDLNLPPVCKIHQADKNTFFALAGLVAEDDKEVQYDAIPIARHACMKSGTLKEKIDAFEEAILIPLTKAVNHIHKKNRTYFNQNRNEMGLGVLISGVENEKLVISRRKYDVKRRGNEFMMKSAGGRDFWTPEEKFDAWVSMDQSFKKVQEFYKNSIEEIKKDSVSAARKFIEQAISDCPDSIGPPIDILRITKDGADWVQRKEICPDIQKN